MTQPPLIAALLDAAAYPHAVRDIRLVETHISWVLLTGTYAYKIKKPVNLGFLDFSTLAQRRHYCEEELRLNRRLAPEIYLDVVPITGSERQPRWGGDGAAIEYALRMQQFPPGQQLDVLLEQDRLLPEHLDAVALQVAAFHQAIAVAGPDTDYGEPATICHAVQKNLEQIRQYLGQDAPVAQLDTLEAWINAACERLRPLFVQRKADGFVRECHGDLHLGNLAWVDERPLLFDCIEFNPGLRWIDIISEVAFLVMDLLDRERPRFAWRFLNAWLEQSGDYAGLALLPFYLLYRATVRAKVEAIRATQAGIDAAEQAAVMRAFDGYLRLAESCTTADRPVLIVTRGPSASGKSTLTQGLLERLGAVRIRSDVERKRLFGITGAADTQAGVDAGIYTAEATVQTYDRLAVLAGEVLAAGYPVIVDAVCQRVEQLERFRELATARQLAFVILEFSSPAAVLRARIEQRQRGVSDADRAVLEHQLADWQALPPAYAMHGITVDTAGPVDLAALQQRIEADCRRIAALQT